jgi:hypothetical protein
MPRLRSFGLLCLLLALGARADDPGARWQVEQMPGGTVEFADATTLTIRDAAGVTVWLREKLRAPVLIRYEVEVVTAGGPLDRLSDVNCFFMAIDPKAPDGCPFAPGFGRSGKFEDYDSLRTYYVGLGGNTNSTTRFRRYAGDGTKPLLPEHDLSEKRALLEANRTYRILIGVSPDGTVTYHRDGQLLFRWQDPAPLREGWFGFRTVHSHQRLRLIEIIQADH